MTMLKKFTVGDNVWFTTGRPGWYLPSTILEVDEVNQTVMGMIKDEDGTDLAVITVGYERVRTDVDFK